MHNRSVSGLARKQKVMSEGIKQPTKQPDRVSTQHYTARASPDDVSLVEMLRNGNEGAFVSLVERYQTTMLPLALISIPDRAVAEEIVQESWLRVLEGLNHFQARSSLKTWIFHILTNRSKSPALPHRRT